MTDREIIESEEQRLSEGTTSNLKAYALSAAIQTNSSILYFSEKNIGIN
jgi:hypothetical protein